MVITRLVGGLGNQMFQYAAGRCLANKHNTDLKLDISAIKQYRHRNYSLHHLRIQENLATPKEVFYYTGRPQTIIQKLWCRFTELWKRFCDKTTFLPALSLSRFSPSRPRVYSEPHFHFDPNFFRLPEDVYLDGYWQAEKYFEDIEDVIRQEFEVKVPLSGEDLEIALKIKGTESVSVHVRRGDYVTNQQTNMVHGCCELEYYLKCIKYAAQVTKEPHFFVFSDDPTWVTENIRIDYPLTYVDHNNTSNAHEDLRLMSFCKHNIISNSTLGWWAAWLNINRNKRIFAPKRWFRKSEVNIGDLLPIDWNAL